MSNQNISLSHSDDTLHTQDMNTQDRTPNIPVSTNTHNNQYPSRGFWHDRLFECGLILSLFAYYSVGNSNLKVLLAIHLGMLTRLNPLFSLPFLLLFALLCWYRLSFAVALFPLTLPYYLLQKKVIGNASFSLAEITLWLCLTIALLQFIVQRRRWPYHLSLSVWRQRIGPFLWLLLVFLFFAFITIFIAYQRANALRAFREEVLGPLCYLGLALVCLRSRQDIIRLLAALFGTGLVIAILGIIQYLFFKNTIIVDSSSLQRISAVYGSANSIALLVDYTLPIGMAFVLARGAWRTTWLQRLAVLLLCIPFLFVLSQSDSRGGALIAIPIAFLFVLAFSIRNRKVLLLGSLAFLLIGSIVIGVYHNKIYDSIFNGHASQRAISNGTVEQSTVSKRFYLWESAWNMIHDSPWLGYGMDNWLCHYSSDYTNECLYTQYERTHHPDQVINGFYQPGPLHPKVHAYWIINDPKTGAFTGLSDEPNLSHPHNIFLHVWVSIGLFGLLAFISVLVLFYWLFARLLLYLNQLVEGQEQMRWMIIGVGAAMLAALVQGQVDSAFLEQDLSFCFWILVSALLILRALAGMPWRLLVTRVHSSTSLSRGVDESASS